MLGLKTGTVLKETNAPNFSMKINGVTFMMILFSKAVISSVKLPKLKSITKRGIN